MKIKWRNNLFMSAVSGLLLPVLLAAFMLGGCGSGREDEGADNAQQQSTAAAAISSSERADAGLLTFGTSVQLEAKQAAAEGSTIVFDKKDFFEGMTLTVPEGAFSAQTTFKVSATEIEGHNKGEYFKPITPLITVDNGQIFADVPMIVSIPIKVEDDEFALAFYYDKASGRLEAIPFKNITNERIEVITSHFSDIVVSSIKKETLEKMDRSTSASIDTGFEPGKDDWQFANNGSFLSPGGHCAGQSITMAWYYSSQYKALGEPRLFGRFDNNMSATKTAEFWFDDSQGYRFASMAQELFSMDKTKTFFDLTDEHEDYTLTFNAFAYAMLMTGEPQQMIIYKKEMKKIIEGHAIVAYKIENGRIYVADPNYPAQKDRYVEAEIDEFEEIDFDGNETGKVTKFLLLNDYSSGSDATAIAEKGVTIYNYFYFAAQSALIDNSVLDSEYKRMLTGNVGDNKFPAIGVTWMSGYSGTSGAGLAENGVFSSIPADGV
ncbi:MAG: hypothetical protein PHG48_02440, partial [Eubacteriales bacterium]|nr:hypothetical protein [Eubacteriales bacterium]